MDDFEEIDRAINGKRFDLRDLFAMAALSHVEINQGRFTLAPILAEAAYAIADAMLAEREKRNG